ncbi:protein of unknown function [Pararobbsia alpina]|uniref:hypothetical protein n=1 Tax=Pararobbsia alpina TaxID=621374 RepID=UPI0039A5EBCB
MSNRPSNQERDDRVKVRRCPGCGSPLSKFAITALPMPIEQYWLPRLQEINNTLGFSIRGVGQTDVLELQFIAFTGACESCSLISTWDFSAAEINAIAENPHKYPHAQIQWRYAPETVNMMVANAPAWIRPTLEGLRDRFSGTRAPTSPTKSEG